jgi:hypothetical protein
VIWSVTKRKNKEKRCEQGFEEEEERRKGRQVN